MLFQPLGFQPICGHPCGGRADLVLGLKINALVFERAVVDPGVDTQLTEPFIDMGAPGLAPVFQPFGPVPVPHLGTEAVFVHRP